MAQDDLRGRVAIVTGSATGIGAATALGLARRGANIVVNYTKSETEANDVAAAIRDLGVEVRVVQGDVANDEDCRRLAREAQSAWGRIDILVNNAGTTKFVTNHADLDSLSAEDFAHIYAVNVIGPFQMIRACIDGLRAAKPGAVVNVSSIAGVAGVGSSVAYAASKGALNTMTYSLARALAPMCASTRCAPGYVDTNWFVKQFGREQADRISASQEKSALLTSSPTAGDREDSLFLAGPSPRTSPAKHSLRRRHAPLDGRRAVNCPAAVKSVCGMRLLRQRSAQALCNWCCNATTPAQIRLLCARNVRCGARLILNSYVPFDDSRMNTGRIAAARYSRREGLP